MSIPTQELVINFHMTEVCNYRCTYCYAKWNDNHFRDELHLQSGQVELLLSSLAGFFLSENPFKQEFPYQTVRINFAGGEPMVLGKQFINALEAAKALGFRTSIITNGHFLTSDMLEQTSSKLDMLGISFDTADELIAQSIGRADRRGRWLNADQLVRIANTYRQLNSKGQLKINTVVNPFNWHENMSSLIAQVQPDKWKLLRVLPVHDVRQVITSEQYQAYVDRHAPHVSNLIAEDNDAMWASYLMINPQGRFYQNNGPEKGHLLSDPILKTGVEQAFSQIPFDFHAFANRYTHGVKS